VKLEQELDEILDRIMDNHYAKLFDDDLMERDVDEDDEDEEFLQKVNELAERFGDDPKEAEAKLLLQLCKSGMADACTQIKGYQQKRDDGPTDAELEQMFDDLVTEFGDSTEDVAIQILYILCGTGLDAVCGPLKREVDASDISQGACKNALKACRRTGNPISCYLSKRCQGSTLKRDVQPTPTDIVSFTMSGVTVVGSSVRGSPGVMVESWAGYGLSGVMTITVPTQRDVRVLATPTPGLVTTEHYTINKKPASAVFSVVATSPALVIVEKYYDGAHARTHTRTFAPRVTSPVLRARQDNFTIAATTAATGSTSGVPLIRVTDDEGRPVYVTRTDNFAANTKTLTYDQTSPAAVTHSGTVTEYRILTETVTACPRAYNRFLPATTVFELGNSTIAMTASRQTLDNSDVVVVPPQPEATLMPLSWDPKYAFGYDHLLNISRSDAQNMYSGLDWNAVDHLAWGLGQHNGELEPELNFNRALILHVRNQHGDPAPYATITSLDRNNVKKYFGGPTVVKFHGSYVTMDQPTKTMKGPVMIVNSTQTTAGPSEVIVVDPLAKYRSYDPRYNRVVPTPACEDVHNKNRTECRLQQCMWRFMEPINIVTAFPAQMNMNNGDRLYDYFTHTTSIDEVHWGTHAHHGMRGLFKNVRTYFPAKPTVTVLPSNKHRPAKTTCALVRELPTDPADPSGANRASHLANKMVYVGNPKCYDVKSCHEYCIQDGHKIRFSRNMLALMIALPGLGLLGLLAFCCCGIPMIMRRRRDRNDPDRMTEKIRRRVTGNPPGAVVNSVTGQATDPATGQVVNPSSVGPSGTTMLVAGAAAGAAAAKAQDAASGGGSHGEGSGHDGGASGAGGAGGDGDGHATSTVTGDDGKGTMGRAAEEGRGRVRFDPPEGGAKPEAIPAGEPHVEAVPKTDGAADGMPTGRQMADMGSMRGRKRSRPEDQGGLNLGF